jgi:type II secretory pathway pseudopilin PulG
MGLHGQRGYAMAALLVSLAVMAVLMSVAFPAWRHLARREKEAELAFRGEQYARAVALYRAKNGNAFPPSVDVLVQGRYLRKKYKDPMTPDGEFRIIPVGNPQAPQGGDGRGGTPPSQGRGGTPPTQSPNPPGQTGSFVSGGIMGVASKSTETSIRIYKGQTTYNLWPFTFNMVNRPGGNMPNAGNPGTTRPGPGRGRGTGATVPGPGRGGRGTEVDEVIVSPGRGRPGRGGPVMGPDGRPLFPPPPPPPFPVGRGRGGGGDAPSFYGR